MILFGVVPGCVMNTQLLADNYPAALQAAKREAESEFPCPQAAGSIQSQSILQGAPLGYLWTDYTVDIKGCGRQRVYNITCLNKELCSANKL